MTATAYSAANPIPRLLLILVAIGLALIAAQVSAHAIARHSADAITVNTALCEQGPDDTMHNPETDRTAFVVCLPDGKFGVQIDDACGTNITCLIKEKLLRIDQVRQWLRNGGYIPIVE